MLESLKRYLYLFMYRYHDTNTLQSAVSSLLLMYAERAEGEFFHTQASLDVQTGLFYFTNDEQFNKAQLLSSYPDFFKIYNSEIVPEVNKAFPILKDAEFMNADFWREIMNDVYDSHESSSSMISYARNHPALFTMNFPSTENPVISKPYYLLNIYNQFDYSPDLHKESELFAFTNVFFSTLIEVYAKRVKESTVMPKAIKEMMQTKIYNFSVLHNSCFGLPAPEKPKSTEPEFSEEELAQQDIWKKTFDQWWNLEGQYLRGGGNDYEKSFAWSAWLKLEQVKQKEIHELEIKISRLQAIIPEIS